MTTNDPARILLANPRPEGPSIVESALEGLDVTVVRAGSDEEACRLAVKGDFAAILLDATTPGPAALDLARRLRDRGRDRGSRTPILFLGVGSDFPLEDAYALRAVDHLVEPVSPTILRAKVAPLVGPSRRGPGADELWRTTLASIGDAVIATDTDGRVSFLNPVAEQLTGWTLADARGAPLTEVFRIVNEATRQPVENPALRALQSGVIVGLANHAILIARDGVERPIDDSAAPIRDDAGRVTGAVLVFRDIAERKQAELAQARLAAIVESSHDAIVGKDLDGIIRSWNAGAERIFGYATAEAVGKSITLIIPADRLDEERTILDRLRRGERVEHFETRRMRKDGGHVDVALTISPIRDPEGRIIGASKIARDVTAARRAERDMASALQAGEVGTYYWDLKADRVSGDRNFARIFGVLADDRTSAPVGDFLAAIHPDDRDRVSAEIRQTLDFGADFRSEYRLNDPSGERWLLVRGAIERAPGGEPIGWAGVVVDITERRRAEEALRESEQRFRSLFESMDEGYCVVEPVLDPDGRAVDYRYLLVNPALEQHTGLTDIIGKTAIEVMPGHESHWIEAYARVAATGEPFRRIDWVADLNRWYDVSAFRVGDPGDNQVGVLFTDISDRKRAEALLREKDERLQLLIDRARDYAMVVTDRDGRVVEWAGGAESITGIAPGEILGRSAEVLFTATDRAAGVPAKEMEQAAREGRAEDKRWHVRKDGNQFFADGVMVPLRGDDGALRGFGKVFRDLTARKRAEESVQFLADAGASLAELVDYQSTLNRIANLAVGGFADWCVVDMIDEDGRRDRLAVTAAEADDVIAARAADAEFRPSDGRPGSGLVPHVLRTGEPEVVFDLDEVDPKTAPQGPERLASLRSLGIRSYLCVPLRSRGRVIGGLTFLSSSSRRRFGPEELRVAQNLAERVTVAIENAQLYRQLQEQDRRKDEFLATLAHELRNPLAPVRNGLQILRMVGASGETAGQTLSMMDRQIRHITHLVDDLMDVARVSSGKVALRWERLSLRSIVDAAVETSRQAIEAAGHELALRLPTEPLAVEADRTRIVQVLANLLNNAAKYTPPGGRIALGVARQAGQAVIKIADTGVGIPAEMIPKVFDMFTQVGTSLERSQGGLGIGLTLVKRLVEMHGGTVSAQSPGPGEGSTFTVRLPLAAEAPPAAAAAPGGAVGRPGHLPDILVVDDNRDSAASLAQLLEMRGHRVKTVHDGPEALRLLATFRPQLILLDLGLPGMSGYEIARRIRESTELKGVTLAAITGWGQEEDRRRTREAGFDHHLVKPADPDEILRIVDGVRPGAVARD